MQILLGDRIALGITYTPTRANGLGHFVSHAHQILVSEQIQGHTLEVFVVSFLGLYFDPQGKGWRPPDCVQYEEAVHFRFGVGGGGACQRLL